MTNADREKLEIIEHQARVFRELWLREREKRLALQLAANAEVRKRWMSSDSISDGSSDTLSQDEGLGHEGISAKIYRTDFDEFFLF